MLLRKAWAFLKRDLTESLSYKFPLFFDLAGIAASVLTFFFISRVLVPGASPHLAPYGGDYFPFVLVGLAFGAYQTAALNSLSRAISLEQGCGTLEAILITRTSLSTVMLAGSLWSLVFATARVVCYLLIGGLLCRADLSAVSLPGLAVAAALTVASLAGPALFSAGFVLVFKRGAPVAMLLNGASKLLAGVYFPVAVMPGCLQSAAGLIPLTYSLEALRKAALRGAGPLDLGPEFLALALFTLLLLPPGLAFLCWSIRRAKEEGSLGFH